MSTDSAVDQSPNVPNSDTGAHDAGGKLDLRLSLDTQASSDTTADSVLTADDTGGPSHQVMDSNDGGNTEQPDDAEDTGETEQPEDAGVDTPGDQEELSPQPQGTCGACDFYDLYVEVASDLEFFEDAGCAWLGILSISGADIESAQGLQCLDTVGEGILVRDNPRLESLDGLDGLREIEGGMGADGIEHGFSLHISNNPRLSNLDALSNLTWLENELHIINNPQLPTCRVEELVARLKSSHWVGTAVVHGNCDSCQCE